METSKQWALVQYIQLKYNQLFSISSNFHPVFRSKFVDPWVQQLVLLYCFLSPFHSFIFICLCWFNSKSDNSQRISHIISANYRSLQGTNVEHSLAEEMMRTLCCCYCSLFWCDRQEQLFDCFSTIIPGVHSPSDCKTITLWSTITWGVLSWDNWWKTIITVPVMWLAGVYVGVYGLLLRLS